MVSSSRFPFVRSHFDGPRFQSKKKLKPAKYFNWILLELAKDNSIDQLELLDYLRMITEIAAHSLDVARVGAWTFNSTRTRIRCVDLFEKNLGQHTRGMELKKETYPTYFTYLNNERLLAADDVQVNSATMELQKDYLFPFGIVSMMDVPLRRSGAVFGVLCSEHVGRIKRHWTPAEQSFAVSLSEIIAKALEIASRRASERGLQQANADLQRLNQELQSARAEADKANAAKSEFLTQMSHEIRTPLGAMLGFMNLLKDPNLGPESREVYLNIIERNGKNLLNIINSILDLAKIESGTLDVNFSTFQLKEFLDDLVTLISQTAHERNLKLNLHLSDSLPRAITSDPTRLNQILFNIIGNAIKFTPAGSINISSHSSPSSDGTDRISFLVEDTGIGMSPTQQQTIFHRFGSPSPIKSDFDSGKYGGLGVGLALSKKLALKLGGDIHLLRSEMGVGSTFEVTIVSDPRQVKTSERPQSETASQNGFQGLHVLSVDDSADMQMLLELLLKDTGVQIEQARNGEEGIRKALTGDFDLVLMDLQMPVMNGYQTLDLLRSRGFQKPVLALTAHAMSTEMEKCLESGFSDFLTKPIDRDHLLSKLAKFSPNQQPALN